MTDQTIGFLGSIGSYSHQAATIMRPDAEPVGFTSFEALVDAVNLDKVDEGAVPFENSSSGAIPNVLPLIASTELFVTQERLIDIHHVLVAQPGATRDQITTIYSHPQGFLQSSRFLAEYLPDAEQEPKSDTASAIRDMVKKKDPSIAAIGSEFAAHKYSAEIIQQGISNRSDNITRFVLIGKDFPVDDACNMTSIVIQVNHDANALAKALAVFGDTGINMMKLETFNTIEKVGLPTFYVELSCGTEDERFAAAVDQIQHYISSLKILGSYQADPARTAIHGFLEP